MFGTRRADTILGLDSLSVFPRHAMRKIILCGLVGLVSVGMIVGCSNLRKSREDCSNGQCSAGLAPKKSLLGTAGDTTEAKVAVSLAKKTKKPIVGAESVAIAEATAEPKSLRVASALPEIPPVPN